MTQAQLGCVVRCPSDEFDMHRMKQQLLYTLQLTCTKGEQASGELSVFLQSSYKNTRETHVLSVDPGVRAQVFSVPDRFVVMKV